MPTAHPGTPESNEVAPDEILRCDYPGSDIVLRSCDSHDFWVPKLYIDMLSPVLRELIRSISDTSDVPIREQPVLKKKKKNNKEPELLPVVVNLPESKATLHSLLTFSFPVTPILPPTAEKIMELLAVAQKYQMDSVLSHIRGAIARQDPPFVRLETAFHVYFLAQKNGLHLEALQAARATLRLSMSIEELGDKLEFPGMTGAYLHELWKYHKQVRTDLESDLLKFRNSGVPGDLKRLFYCSSACYYGPYSLSKWLDDYIKSVAGAPHLIDPIELDNARARHIKDRIVPKPNPHPPSLEHNLYTSLTKPCSCGDISSRAIRAFWEALTPVVHRTIGKADSTLALVKEDPASENSDPPSIPLCLDMPDARIILRSSDQVNFRVHKSLLAMSSPFFKDLLSLPRPPDDELVDGLPVVQFPEGSGLLNGLISLLYPVSPVIPSSYEKVFALLAACQKYDMESIQPYIRAEIKRGIFPAPAETDAFGAYAIASSMALVPEMEDAARLTLCRPMTFESLGEELRLFKGRALCDLVRYRKRGTQGR